MKHIVAAILLLMMSPVALHAAEPLDYGSFTQIPVLHEGRIKPLDSFARVMFRRISGEASPEHSSATAWLARLLFAPQEALAEPMFAVRSSELLHMLSLPARPEGKYSFGELAAAFGAHRPALAALAGKDKKSLTAPEQELVALYNNVNDFADIIGTFSLLAPLTDVTPQVRHALGVKSDAPVSYLELLKIRQDWGGQAAKLRTHLAIMEAVDGSNALLRIIPPSWEGSEEWLSPWAVLANSAGSPQAVKRFADWETLAVAYRQGDAGVWQQASWKLLAEGENARGVRPMALAVEVLYDDFNPLQGALVIYVLALALAVAGLFRYSAVLNAVAYAALCLGAVVQATGISARMFILLRPPVSTLYESMLFVSFVAVLFGLWLERKRRGADGLIISSAIACLLLAAARIFAGSNDTLEVLVAVLNTNFWLATHVVCITTGYGSSLVAGTLAHLYLFRRAAGKATETQLAALQRRMHMVALVALLFTAVGTMLGGIWADQSWGRFWGWDPKENGALWIVLWLIWLLHGRVTGQLRPLGFAVGTAFVNIVVALAWVGVNLLSVGLHSYGFTDTAANGLVAFCGTECAFIGIAACIILCRNRSVPQR